MRRPPKTPHDFRLVIIRLAKRERDRRTPYHWGGQKLGVGVDCSGLVLAIWQKLHLWPQSEDTTAHGLYVKLPSRPIEYILGGDLIFYGRRRGRHLSHPFKVTHVGIYTGRDHVRKPYVISAAGGGRWATSPAVGLRRHAYVKQHRLHARHDFAGCGSIDHVLEGRYSGRV